MNEIPNDLSGAPATPVYWNQLAPRDGRAHEVVLSVGDDDVWCGEARVERWPWDGTPGGALHLSVGNVELASVTGTHMSRSYAAQTGHFELEGASEDGQVTLKVKLAPTDTPTNETVSVRYS